MDERKTILRVVCLTLLLAGLSFSQVFASPRGVLNDMRITSTKENVVVKVSFNVAVSYLRHYPLDSGQELNIQLDPLPAGGVELSRLHSRASLPAPENNPAGLVRIEYAGSELVKPTVRLIFTRVTRYQVKQGEDYRSLEILLPPLMTDEEGKGEDVGQGPAGPRPLVMLSPQRQEELLQDGEQSMAREEYMHAILVYSKLLDSTDPRVRESAQFRLARAQELKGHLAHARAEYRNYLTMYPEGENAGEARERLQALTAYPGAPGDMTGLAEGEWLHDYFGSVSVYYDRDESLYEDDRDIVNISSLTTGFDATWRSRSSAFKAEAVAVGNYELSFLSRRDNHTRVSRLYLDFEDAAATFISRVGRQSSSKGGVFSARFDGARVGYRIMDKVRLNAVGGFPVNLSYDGLETDKYFYGINADFGRFGDHWDINTYFINQVADDIDDRRAVGGEVRFTAPKGSFYSLVDYDVLFDDLSVFLFSGNYRLSDDKTMINLLVDFRGVPVLSASNALIGQISPSLEALEEAIGEDELRRLAEDRTLDSSFVNVSVSHMLTDNLQIAGDVSWSEIDGAPASGGVEAFESTGDEFFYSLQLIGSGLLQPRDIATVGLRYADTKYRDTSTFTLNYRYTFFDDLFISPRMRIDYRENNIQEGEQWRFIPGLRLEYILAADWRFEIDAEYQYADQELPGVAGGKDGYTVSIGFRRNF